MLLKNTLSIKDLEALSGIKAHTIRIWEQRYHIIEPVRTDTNIRCYSNDDLKAILIISCLNRHGYKISRIAEMTPEERISKLEEIYENNGDYSHHIEAMTLAMVDLDEAKFEKVISRCTIQFGFEKLIEHVVFPFLEKIGVMWMTGSIHPAQEHFVSSLIRQKLIVAIDGQPLNTDSKAPRFLLFLPEGELHEIGLLYACYLLRAYGRQVIYLGHNVPMSDVEAIASLYRPEFLYTVITVTPVAKDLEVFLSALSEAVYGATIYVTGAQVNFIRDPLPPNVHVLTTLTEMHEMLAAQAI
jgi:MerR family transcriptional regulator, light-induced transcriptional regulator